MDSLSQAALGAAIGEAVLGKKIGNKGAVLGAAVATIPDLDVVFYFFYDKFEMLSIHRGYSHSILFSVVGALLIAYILQRVKWAKKISFLRLYVFAWLALFTHLLLDTFTAYGTQLFLPFSDERASLDSINVVDPVYTIPLLIGLLFSLFIYKNNSRRPIFNKMGLIISTLYLFGTLGVKSHVDMNLLAELKKENIHYVKILTMPVGVANINWYGVAKTNDGLYMHKYSIINGAQSGFEYFPINDHYLDELNPKVADKMRWFAKGFYTVEKVDGKIRVYNLQVDMRGVFNDGKIKAPTMGYFEITPLPNGGFEFTSGAHKK